MLTNPSALLDTILLDPADRRKNKVWPSWKNLSSSDTFVVLDTALNRIEVELGKGNDQITRTLLPVFEAAFEQSTHEDMITALLPRIFAVYQVGRREAELMKLLYAAKGYLIPR